MNNKRPYKCTARIALPSHLYAEHLKDVISVDQEISDKVVKSFLIVSHDCSDVDDHRVVVGGDDDGFGDNMRVLEMWEIYCSIVTLGCLFLCFDVFRLFQSSFLFAASGAPNLLSKIMCTWKNIRGHWCQDASSLNVDDLRHDQCCPSVLSGVWGLKNHLKLNAALWGSLSRRAKRLGLNLNVLFHAIICHVNRYWEVEKTYIINSINRRIKCILFFTFSLWPHVVDGCVDDPSTFSINEIKERRDTT